MWSANRRIRLYKKKKKEARFCEWNGTFWTFGQIWVTSLRYPRWNPCTPSLHHVSPFGKYRHQLFTISFHESPWFQFLARALKTVLSRATGTKQLFWCSLMCQVACHTSLLSTQEYVMQHIRRGNLADAACVSFHHNDNGQC